MRNTRFSHTWSHLIDTVIQFERNPTSLRFSQEQLPPGQYHLLATVVRHASLIQHCIKQHCAHPPKAKLHALMMIAVADLLPMDDAGVTDVAVKVHHAVDQTRLLCSERESGFVNAVLRKIAVGMADGLSSLESSGDWATRFSHPKWLIDRWIKQHGADTTLSILRWNQGIPSLHVHDPFGYFHGGGEVPSAESLGLHPSLHQDFYRIEHSGGVEIHALLKHPLYIQDPSTAVAPGLLIPGNPENILDACAAPGGKMVHLRKSLGPDAKIWLSDVSENRLRLLRENCDRLQLVPAGIACIDWGQESPDYPDSWPETFDAVLIDAPCSSIGIIQKHPEIRWRLQKEDYDKMPQIQLSLLRKSAPRVRPGGQLVFSTCSFDAAENQSVIDAFLSTSEGQRFQMSSSKLWIPGSEAMDGGGATLLKAMR